MNQTQTTIDFSVVTEIEIRYRNPIKSSQRPKVTTAQTAYELFLDSWNPDTLQLQESFKVMLLSRQNQVLGIMQTSIGGIAGTVADVRIIFAAALKAAATSIILCHNHPSGDPRPSKTDCMLTKKIKAAGKLLDIQVLDHIIIAPGEGYYSFADNAEL